METRYRASASTHEQSNKWIRISFDARDDTTSLQNHPKKKQKKEEKQEMCNQQKQDNGAEREKAVEESAQQGPPESVLQYQRQMRKIQAADRASKTNVNIKDHLHVVHADDHVVVTNKPSGILCVPGVNKYKSLLDLVYEVYGRGSETADGNANDLEQEASTSPSLPRDSMIAHRLDMDTSGIVIFARTRLAMSKLHESFRERTGTKKIYEALLVGWLDLRKWKEWADECDSDIVDTIGAGIEVVPEADDASVKDTGDLGGGEINLPLQRDHKHPPFMRVSTPESEADAKQAVKDLNHAGYKKLIAKKPKPSTTRFRILSHEKWMGHPVTRVQLMPITGRTHQLRVHCAAMGHPILGDPAYGFCGEAHPNGGFSDEAIRKMSPTCASFELRRDVEDAVQEEGRTMCLHARSLTLDHPATGEKVSFEAEPDF